MKKLLIAATALSGFLASGGAALAADPVIDDPAYDWTGFYIGINGGYGWSDSERTNLFTDDITPSNLGDSTDESRGTIGKLKAEGEFGGLQAGYNLQSDMFVFGIEGDIQYSGIGDERSGDFTNPNGAFNPIEGEASLDLDWFGTVRGRVGASFDRLLFYITGGVAFGDVDYELEAIETGGGALFETSLKSSKTEVGYVVGGGAEFAFAQNWTMKLEYQYLDFGNIDADSPVTNIVGGAQNGTEEASSDIDAAFHTVRLGVNFKF